jgi:hypothetical protein
VSLTFLTNILPSASMSKGTLNKKPTEIGGSERQPPSDLHSITTQQTGIYSEQEGKRGKVVPVLN